MGMLDELVAKISAASMLSRDDVMEKIEEKTIELSGLVSDEGAAYLVAKELGVHLKREEERLNIGNIMPGMQNVDIIGKVTRIFPAKDFKTERAEGRVASIIISDRTGSVRLSLWNDEVEKLHGMEIGDVVNVKGFVRGNGQPEIRLGRRGSITKTEQPGFENVIGKEQQRYAIKELGEKQRCTVRAPILQIFESNIFYEICPECKTRLKELEDGFECAHHGKVDADYGIVLSGIIDDGTASMRAVFFGESAEKLLGISKAEARNMFDKKKKIDAVLSLIPLGKEFIFEGVVKRNEFFDRLEFIVNDVKSVDIKKEIEMMMEKGANNG